MFLFLKLFSQDTVIQILEKQPGLPYLNPEFLEVISAPKPVFSNEDTEQRVAHQEKQAHWFKLKVESQPTDQNLLPSEDVGDLGDLFADMALLERAGVGFGREETMRIYLALKVLLHQPKDTLEGEKITRARLWGKILGTKQVHGRPAVGDRIRDPSRIAGLHHRRVRRRRTQGAPPSAAGEPPTPPSCSSQPAPGAAPPRSAARGRRRRSWLSLGSPLSRRGRV